MKPAIKPAKSTTDELKPNVARPNAARPKSNLKAAFGKYKGVIIEEDNCWNEDLKKTIAD